MAKYQAKAMTTITDQQGHLVLSIGW